MRYFDSLRVVPWTPKFSWVETTEEAADQINRPHEDYPDRVDRTVWVLHYWNIHLRNVSGGIPLGIRFPQILHADIFNDTNHAGKWRESNVTVGLHRPPDYSGVSKFMDELSRRTPLITEVQQLKDWYTDFETIHPFLDGNGRVGGSIISIFSHILEPNKGYLAPCQ